jgi:predicted SAM-dependent methyltransferase
MNSLQVISNTLGFDIDKLRLNVGGGNVRYSNCINIELEPHPEVDADFYGDITKGLLFDDETFVEVLMIHVIEHIERKNHKKVLEEIWRVLKPNGRLILGFPDFIECAKRFIDNKFGGRWSLYHNTIFGRQGRNGDFHVTAMERNDITDRLISAGFVNVKYLQHSINATVTAYKGDKLKDFI